MQTSLIFANVRLVLLTQVRLVWLIQDSQLSGFFKALMYASSVELLILLVTLDLGIWARGHAAWQEPLL